jgi:hypothetical protein
MSFKTDPHPYSISFIYPADATLATAAASITIKAPERGDRRTKGRNQSFARMKNANVAVYDMGTQMSDLLSLSFEDVYQAEFAALIVFFEYITWGANKIKYVDYKGDSYIVRVYKNTVDATNNGEAKFGTPESTLYNFTLDLIDVTNNVSDSGQTAVPTQLALHLADFVHPHNPKTVATVVSADGTKIIEVVKVDDTKAVTWIVQLSDAATYSRLMLVHATHDGTVSTDATAVSSATENLVTNGSFPGDVTITVTLALSGSSQVLRLNVAKAAGSISVAVRRVLM